MVKEEHSLLMVDRLLIFVVGELRNVVRSQFENEVAIFQTVKQSGHLSNRLFQIVTAQNFGATSRSHLWDHYIIVILALSKSDRMDYGELSYAASSLAQLIHSAATVTSRQSV